MKKYSGNSICQRFQSVLGCCGAPCLRAFTCLEELGSGVVEQDLQALRAVLDHLVVVSDIGGQQGLSGTHVVIRC